MRQFALAGGFRNGLSLRYDRVVRLSALHEAEAVSSPIVPPLIDLPSELRGPRVLLRPYRVDDAEQLFAAINESLDHLRPWVTWLDNNRSLDDVRDYCIRSQANWLLRTDLALGIFDAVSGRYLGGTGLHDPDWHLRAFEIGYWLRVTAVGRRIRN